MSSKRQTTAYSPETNTHYPSWEALVEAESNGYVAVMVLSSERETWPYVSGPYPTKAEAERARGRLRSKWRRERESREHAVKSVRFFVRPAWRDPR